MGINAGVLHAAGESDDVSREEQPVGRDPNQQHSRLDAAQRGDFRFIPARKVERVHRFRESEIRISGKAVRKALALIIEITGNIIAPFQRRAGVFAAPVRLPGEALREEL